MSVTTSGMVSCGTVVLLHNRPLAEGETGWESSRDVLVQVEAVAAALEGQGQRTARLAFAGDTAALFRGLDTLRPSVVFNLCESVNEDQRLIGHPVALLELCGIPCTGSSSFALMASTDKMTAKLLLRGAGIPTPDFFLYQGQSLALPPVACPLIAKPRYEDASVGIDQDSVFYSATEFVCGIRPLFERHGPLVVESYIEGREMNIAVIGAPELAVLAVAEIDFSAFPLGLHRIVGYGAKWREDSFEYGHSPRIFPGSLDPDLRRRLEATALASCLVMQVRDYGRVDVRVDGQGRVHVLEVNANPCLSPDAGFAAAARESGMSYAAMVSSFLDFVKARS